MHRPVWLTTALLFPVLLCQGKQARQKTPRLPEAGVVLLSMGVNDATGFTTRYRFRQQLIKLRQLLAPRYPGPLFYSAFRQCTCSQRCLHRSDRSWAGGRDNWTTSMLISPVILRTTSVIWLIRPQLGLRPGCRRTVRQSPGTPDSRSLSVADRQRLLRVHCLARWACRVHSTDHRYRGPLHGRRDRHYRHQ